MHHSASQVALLPKPSAVAVGKLKKPCVIDRVSLPHQNWLAFDDILCQGLGNGETDNAENTSVSNGWFCVVWAVPACARVHTARSNNRSRALCAESARVAISTEICIILP